MTQFQVRPKNEEESQRVQLAMFALGYLWKIHSANPKAGVEIVEDIAGRAILASADGELSWVKEMDDFLDRFPLAQADKIITEAIKKLAMKYLEESWPLNGLPIRPLTLNEATNRARSNLGLPPLPFDDKGGPGPCCEYYDIPGIGRIMSRVGLVAAVKSLEAQGYTYNEGSELWKPPLGEKPDWLKPYTPFWMVYREGGEGSVFQYPFEAEAQDEAKRLARATPGGTVYVLAACAAFRADKPVVHEIPRGEEVKPF